MLAELADIRAFTEERVNGVWSEHDSLDAQIEPFLENWSLYRLGTIERNVLRLTSDRRSDLFDEFSVKAKPGEIVFWGNTQRGTLFAVYGFLENILGVVWPMPGDANIVAPKTGVVRIPAGWSWKISRKIWNCGIVKM